MDNLGEPLEITKDLLTMIEKKIKLLGEITDEEKNKLLSLADIFLFPSITQSEAYGLVLESIGKISSNVPFIMPKRVAETDPF